MLAAAGLERLGRLSAATELFAAHQFLPSPGQGAIALQCRADDRPAVSRLAALDDAPTRAAVEAERGFLAEFGSGCSLPIGAYGRLEDGLLKLRAMVGLGGSPDDSDVDMTEVHFGDAAGPPEEAEALGRGLAVQLSGRRVPVGGVR